MSMCVRALGSGGKRVRVCTPRWLISSQISLLDRGKRVDGPCASPRPRLREQPGLAANIIVAQLSTVRAVKWRRETVVLLMIAPFSLTRLSVVGHSCLCVPFLPPFLLSLPLVRTY